LEPFDLYIHDFQFFVMKLKNHISFSVPLF